MRNNRRDNELFIGKPFLSVEGRTVTPFFNSILCEYKY